MNTKTVFISECERDHILSGLRAGFQVTQKDYYEGRPTNDLFVVLDKLGLLNKNLKNMERSDILKYECLRKKMKELRCNAKQLLQSDDISIEEMRTIIRNLNIISKKMKEMSTKLGTGRFEEDELTESEGSDHSHINIQKSKTKVVSPPEPKRRIQTISKPENEGNRSTIYEEVKKKQKVMCSKSSKKNPNKGQSTDRGGIKCVSQSPINPNKCQSTDRGGNKCVSQSQLNQNKVQSTDRGGTKCVSQSPINPNKGQSSDRGGPKCVIHSQINQNKGRSTDRGGTKCVSQSRIADIFSKEECPTPSDLRPKEPKNVKGSYITKYSKSNDHQQHCYDGLVVETCSKCLCRRWSIPSVNRTSLKTYIKNNIKNTGPRTAENSSCVKDCVHSFCKGRLSSKKDDFVALPGLVPNERKHLTAVRNKILKDNACKSGSALLSKNSSNGCCFNSNTDLEVFETSDTSLNKNEEAWESIFDSCSIEYKGKNFYGGNKNTPVSSVDGTTQWDGERSQINFKSNVTCLRPENSREASWKNEESETDVYKCQSNETDVSANKKWNEKVDKCVQSACQKVNQCTSYDNFILHPQFSWSMPMIGQAFKRSIPLNQEKCRYFDKCGKFIRPSKPSADTGTTTKKPKHILVMDRAVQTNDMLFTKNMHQVMYLNVVYTKTHLRYIIPNSMEIPVLSHKPEVIERRAIDKGYAVTTYKADPDGVIHFTLAYSDGDECKTDGNDLPEEANRRLCQLKNLWISSARKFFSQLNEKLVGESGDCEEHNEWPNSLNCTSSYASSVTPSEASEASIKTNDTEC